MNEKAPFQIDLGSLKSQAKPTTSRTVGQVDQVGEKHGFVDRAPKVRRGRKPSPRTGQVHAKTLPEVAEDIANEARRRGVTQGVVIEEAWALYRKL